MPHYRTLTAIAALALALAACGGNSKNSATSTPEAAATTAKTASVAEPTLNPSESARATAAPPGSTLERTPSSGGGFDLARAKELLDSASLTPADLGADWAITADQSSDNAAAAASDPAGAASFDRCGRLLGRLVTTARTPSRRYLTGTLVAAFSQITVYKSAEGAADCAAEGATRFQQPGQLARAFGTVFVNPDAVTVQPLEYPATADGSFAAALTGDINAAGTTVQLQIVIVAFRKGNTSAVVGVAMSPLTNPSTSELKPYVDLVLQRITASQ
jgi:hypothetical protein